MAISDQQIFDWFLANPNADDATVAGAMDQFKLTPADIARATGANVADVQSRYEAATTPAASPTASTAAASTAEASEVYLGDNRWLNTATGQIRTDWNQSAPVKKLVREEDRDGMHYRYYDDGSVDSSVLSTDNFLDFVGDVAPGIALKTALTMAGGPAGSELGLTLGSGLNTALDLGLSTAAQQALGSGIIRGTLADATGGNFITGALSGAAAASPNLNLGDTSITLGNLNTVNKVLNANDAASVLSALAADKTISGATSGILDASTTQALNTGLQVNNIVTQLQAGNEGAALTLLGDLAGSSDLKTAGNAVKAIDAIQNGNIGALTGALTNLSSTAGSTTGTSGSASGGGSTTVGNFEDNEVTRLKGLGYTNAQIQDYFNTLDNLTGAFDETAGTTGTTTSGLPTGVQLASLGDGVFKTDVSGVPTYAESANASSITAPFGYTLLSTSEVDNKPAGAYYDITANAWFKPDTAATDLTGNATIQADADLFNSSLGTLDQLDANLTANDFEDFLRTIGITNATQLSDSGLSNQDILDMINALDDTVTVTGGTGNDTLTGGTTNDLITGGTGNDNLETLTVTGAKGNDTITGVDTITGAGGNDNLETVTVTGAKGNDTVTGIDTITGGGGNDDVPTITVEDCKDGKVRDPITGECVLPTVTIEDCKDGKVRDPVTGQCVLPTTALDCKPGFVPNDAGTECIPVVEIEACKDGKVRDPITGQCVLPTTDLECADGYEPDATGTKCIPKIVVTACGEGKVRDPITGECVPITKTVDCDPGFHKDPVTGLCVADDDSDECDTGYEKINGTCVPVCKDGYIRNLETGVCEKVEDKGCPPGQVKNAEGKCVPITKTTECQPGYEKVNGVCVPVCQPGYQRVNGVCKKIATDLIPTPIPTTSPLSAEGEKTDPIYAGGMDAFNLMATLEQLLAEADAKKDTKESKQKTKMATGGHLDDLLAEQMTVDDLLKLLR